MVFFIDEGLIYVQENLQPSENLISHESYMILTKHWELHCSCVLHFLGNLNLFL